MQEERGMSRPDVHVDLHLVLRRGDLILIGERPNTQFGAGQYLVPAGRLEVDETIVDGMIREAREETGIEIDADVLELAYVMHFRGESDRLSLFFTAERWAGEITNCEPDKCKGWEWLPVGDLPKNTVPYARHAINDLMASKRLGLFGWASI
jgi:8-oxo-dGTP diphosphatase